MTTIKQLLNYSQTALAAYATGLEPLLNNTQRYNAPGVGMATAQATQFDADWAVLQQSPSDPITGFSAVLLQRKDADGNATGEKVLTISGTNSPADVLSDLGIFLGSTVTDIAQYNALESFYSKLTEPGGKLSSNEQFTITGHSLGGFLAQAFTARHASVVTAAYTFNAPGLGAADTLLGYLGISNAGAAAAKITNVHATDGLSVTAGLGFMLGSTLPVRIENNGITGNHSIVRLSDTLAIYETYARLMPGISITQATALFAASGSGDRRQEDTLDVLRSVFIGSASNDTNKTPTDNHDAFGANLYQLQNNTNFKALSGQVQLVQANASFATSAQATTNTAPAYRYALLELLPFAVVANADAQNQTLYGNYTQRLSLYDPAAGTGDLTQQWLTDRATLLQALVTRSKQDNSTGSIYDAVAPDGRVTFFHFIDPSDPATETVLSTQRQGGTGLPEQHLLFGDDQANTLIGYDNALGDRLYGGAGEDTLDGKGGNDYLEGGKDSDTYTFTGGFGKDTILDSDGSGSLKLDGQTLNGGQSYGEANKFKSKDAAGVEEIYQVRDDARSSTGKILVITKGSDTANSITINNFDLIKATDTTPANTGYLGIKLDKTPAVAVIATSDSAAAANGGSFWSDTSADISTLAGKFSELAEGTGQTFIINLKAAAKAGETLVLSLQGLASQGMKAILGDRTVDAAGASITLNEGQTEVSFALIQTGELTTDASGALSVTYTGANGNATSNTWGVNLSDAGPVSQTANGDQRAKLIGIETQLNITADKPNYNTYAWNETSWAADGTLINGVAELDFSDVIKGTAGNDKIAGLGGNDALDGGAGNDEIDGGSGDDLIGGGAGSDNIKGGDGADYINSSATLNVFQRLRPTDSWSPPAGQVVKTQGAGWGIYLDTLPSGDPIIIWSGSDNPAGTDGDVVDAGAGNDWVIASGGDDRVQGGLDDDQIEGMAGDDVLEGGDGKDSINGDGLIKAGFMNSVEAQYHGADFVDGGAGDDTLTGGGGNDVIYGGADNDKLWGDVGGKTSDADYLDLAYHGSDYLDGEDGNDKANRNAIELVAVYARHSVVAGLFASEIYPLFGNRAGRRHRNKRSCLSGCLAANDIHYRSVA